MSLLNKMERRKYLAKYSCAQILTLTLLLLPLCRANLGAVVAEQPIVTAQKSALKIGELNEKNVQLLSKWIITDDNNNIIPLSVIEDKYSQVKPAIETSDIKSNPSWVENFPFSGNEDMEYVDREFLLRPDSSDASVRSTMTSNEQTYSSKYIAQQIFHAIKKEAGSDPSVTLLIGEPRSGKSLGLAKIQQDIAQLDGSPTFNIRVNMHTIPDGITEKITLKSIINPYVYDFSDGFFETLIARPENIVILFDDIEHTSTLQTYETLPIIRELAMKGVHVAMTGGQYTSDTLRRHNLNPITYEIPQMNIIEMERYLTNIWNSYIKKGIQSTGIIPDSSQRLTDYVTAVSQTMYRMPLPRTPETLNILAELMTIDTAAFESDAQIIFLHDYIFQQDKIPATSHLLDSFENVLLSKMQFYDEFFSRCSLNNAKWPQLIHDYGELAFKQIVQVPENLLPTQLISGMNSIKYSNRDDYDFIEISGKPNDMKIKFNHPDYQSYFGAQYLLELMRSENPQIELLSNIFADAKYSRLLEFINLNIHDSDMDTLMSIAVPDGNIRIDILDNLLRHGFNEIYESIHESIASAAELTTLNDYEKYLQGSIEQPRKHTYRSEYVMGMMPSQEEATDPNYYQRISPIRDAHTRLEAIVQNNLERALLWDSNLNPDSQRIDFGDQDYPRILRNAVTRPIPDFDLVERLMKYVIPEGALTTSDLNDLVYDTINTVGEGSQKIVNLLVQRGAEPKIVSRYGRTLLHAAVQWNSKNLLSYVINDLKVPTRTMSDASRRLLFNDVLDAHPIPTLTPPGWWEMVSFLTWHVELEILDKQFINTHIVMTQEDINTPLHKLLFSDVHGTNEYNVKKLMVKPMTSTDPSYDRLAALSRIQSSKLSGANHETSSLRRKFMLTDIYKQSKDISLLEIFVRYRGTDSLSPSDQAAYRSTIDRIIDNHIESLKPSLDVKTSSRILKTLVNNIGESSDVEMLTHFLKAGLNEMLDPSALSTMKSLLQTHLNEISNGRAAAVEEIFEGFKKRMISDWPQFESLETEDLINKNLKSVPENNNDGNVLSCLRGRRQSTCSISWYDVDNFNDAPNRRALHDIQINSDRFLRTLAAEEHIDPIKVRQLTDLALHLDSGLDGNTIAGSSRMLTRDVIESGGIAAYRQNQRVTNVVNDVWQPSSSGMKPRSFRLMSGTVAMYAAAGLPFVRGIYGTIVTCMRNDSQNACLTAGAGITLSALLLPANYLATKYVPWMFYHGGNIAQDMMPLQAPTLIKNIKLMQRYGMKFGAKAAAVGIGLIGIGMDVYNIVDMSLMINECLKGGDKCPSNTKIDYIISLTFSCVSIAVAGGLMVSGVGFVAGVVIGLAMLVIETLAFGINDVVYYSNNYDTTADENIRIFFHKIGFQPPPADVQALASRTNWIDHLEKHYTDQLVKSNDNIVAYAVGLGTVRNDETVPGSSFINMNDANINNTMGLSRVLPKNTMNNTLLCLPRQNLNEVYDKYSRTEPNAIYRCENAFVIAHGDRWKNKISGQSYIVYDLQYVEQGVIVGSDILNNVFLVPKSMLNLTIHGGGKTSSNTLIVGQHFQGNIILKSESRQNILDLSSSTSNLRFWSFENDGIVEFDNKNNFHLQSLDNQPLNLHVIGQKGQPDDFFCNYEQRHRVVGEKLLSIDGGGGQSLLQMDHVTDCEMSFIHPFTVIKGSNITEITYSSQMQLETLQHHGIATVTYATIEPQQSKFMVKFTARPLFSSLDSVMYIAENETLIWKVQYNPVTLLHLTIAPYRSNRSAIGNNSESQIKTVHCVFVDSYYGSTVYPVINENHDSTDIKEFNVFASVNSSRLFDVFQHYLNMRAFGAFYVTTKLTYPSTNETFTFGSATNDNFYIDSNTRFLFGGQGNDIYTLSSDSSRHVWIKNEADDGAMDTLVIPDGMCDSLKAKINSPANFDCCENSKYDVTLYCSDLNSVEYNNLVVLNDYNLDANNRHLKIYWRESTYILIPDNWTRNYEDDVDSQNSDNMNLALYLSIGEWDSTAMTVTSRDKYIVLNVTDETNPFVAHRSNGNDVLLVPKYFDRLSSSFLTLKNFFNDDSKISDDWLTTRILVVNGNIEDYGTPNELTIESIRDMALNPREDETLPSDGSDIIQQYYFNISEVNENNRRIEINNHTFKDGADKLAVLIVTDGMPDQINAKWTDNGTSLSLCSGLNCVIFENWCRSKRHRLYNIEFFVTFNREPVIVRNLDQLVCKKSWKTYKYDIGKLNREFVKAQKLIGLINENDDNDLSRLIKCVGSLFADKIINGFSFRLFGFSSVIDHARFLQNNCYTLINDGNIRQNLTLATFKGTLMKTMKKYLLSYSGQNDKKSVSLLKDAFDRLNLQCWRKFTTSLYDFDNIIANDNKISLKMLEDSVHTLVDCIAL